MPWRFPACGARPLHRGHRQRNLFPASVARHWLCGRTHLVCRGPERSKNAKPLPSIDDYAEKAKQTATAWNGMSGFQGGDPARCAMTDKPKRSRAQMAEAAAKADSADPRACPRCGCRDWRVVGTCNLCAGWKAALAAGLSELQAFAADRWFLRTSAAASSRPYSRLRVGTPTCSSGDSRLSWYFRMKSSREQGVAAGRADARRNCVRR
jgi:hypothetical protein